MLQQMTALQQQVENLVECSIETYTATRTIQAVLKSADYCLQDLSSHLDSVSQDFLGARFGRNDGQGGLLSGVRLEKPPPFLGNSEDPATLEALLYSCELYFSLVGMANPQ